MTSEKRFLVDVGMQNLPFPIRAKTRAEPGGQPTVANISVVARIMQGFEARWIDRFVQVLHSQRESISCCSLKDHIGQYTQVLNAATVRIDYDYPLFLEKETPVSGERCLVRYRCVSSAKTPVVQDDPWVGFRMEIPCITTYPASDVGHPGGLFGQLSLMDVEVVAKTDVFAEDLVALVDRHALTPVYSFLTPEDQVALIDKIHATKRTSVVAVDAIKEELARNRDIIWYAVRCSNFGMLHSYSTVIHTEKSPWVPFSGYDDDF
jgi:GTP cyclohydrolase IB